MPAARPGTIAEYIRAAPAAGQPQAAFGKELAAHRTTKNYLQIPYDEPIPEDLVRRIAEHQLKAVAKRADEAFW